MSRYRTVLSLGSVVLVVGVASLVATGAFRRLPPPPRTTPAVLATSSPFPLLPVPPFPTPPSCTTEQLEIVGVFNDCAGEASTKTSYCSVTANAFDLVVELYGSAGHPPHDYLLYLSIGQGYDGPGTYADTTVSAMLREYATGALWRSISGVVLKVSGAGGRSGFVTAALAYVGGEPAPPAVGLNIAGAWHCV
jgi:hypothetical protein